MTITTDVNKSRSAQEASASISSNDKNQVDLNKLKLYDIKMTNNIKSSNMTASSGQRDSFEGQVDSFDHVTFWCGNAKQSAVYYMSQFGFKPLAFRGMETGSRDFACHVLKLNDTIFQLVSAVQPNNQELGDFLNSHGDGIKDVAFRVTNIESLVSKALSQGAELVRPIEVLAFEPESESGEQTQQSHIGDSQELSGKDRLARKVLKRATIKAFGDVTHTFIERNFNYEEGAFAPGYVKPSLEMPAILKSLPQIPILKTDHIVGQFPPNMLDKMANWYSKVLNFSRFWSIDEKQVFTNHSGVKTHVVTNHNEQIKMPLCEVMLNKNAKSNQEEFVRFNNGAGIHHIAFLTDDIISVVANMKTRGINFLDTPDIYYDQLKDRLSSCPLQITEDIEELRKHKILVDFDESGYLLQIFTRPVQDRPTLIFEIIQRFNFDGFGAGNFLALFKAIEAETAQRDNL